MSGNLVKLEIQAFSDSKMDNKLGNPYVTKINPEKYSLGVSNDYNTESSPGSGFPELRYNKTLSQELNIDFLFDATGVFFQKNKNTPTKTEMAADTKPDVMPDGQEKNGVDDQIGVFMKIVYDFNGSEHKPNYLKISWGNLIFNCVLKDLQIEYKLFGSDGKPLRAVGKAKFLSFMDGLKAIALENRTSPDLTHVRVVKAGDTLPLMCHRIYGDSKYYVEVAKANKISSFRTLTPGQQIYFPPIEKRS